MRTKLEFAPLNRVAVTAFLVSAFTGFVAAAILKNPIPLIAGFLIGFYLLFAIQVVRPWERVALMRLGRYVGLRGPGFFHMVPVLESISAIVDQRVRVHPLAPHAGLQHRDGLRVQAPAMRGRPLLQRLMRFFRQPFYRDGDHGATITQPF